VNRHKNLCLGTPVRVPASDVSEQPRVSLQTSLTVCFRLR